jgi:hypothetical protein
MATFISETRAFFNTASHTYFLAFLCITSTLFVTTQVRAMGEEQEAPYTQASIILLAEIEPFLPEDLALSVIEFSSCPAGRDVRKKHLNEEVREQIKQAIHTQNPETMAELLACLPANNLKHRHHLSKVRERELRNRRFQDEKKRNRKRKCARRSLLQSKREEPGSEDDSVPQRLLDIFNAIESEDSENAVVAEPAVVVD